MTKDYERHPLSGFADDMTPSEWESFEKSVIRNGVKKTILLWQGKVLDGWHRYRAAKNNDLPFETEQFTGTVEEAKERVRIEHERRNWSGSQRAHFEARVDAYDQGGEAASPPRSVAQQAEAAQVTERTMQQARAVVRNAIPRVNQAVADGNLSVERAAKISRLPAKKQDKELDKPKAAKKPWRAPDRMPKPEVGASKEAHDELREKHSVLADEIDRLSDRVAVLASGAAATEEERTLYEDTLKGLRSAVKTLEAELTATKASRNSHMAECNELKKEVSKLRSQLTKYRDQKAA